MTSTTLNLGQLVAIVGENSNYKNCEFCNKRFKLTHSKDQKFCSHYCYGESKVGIPHSEEQCLKMSASLKGKPKSKEHIQRVVEARKYAISKNPSLLVHGKDHWQWKGDKVGYCALHDWIKKYKVKTSSCSRCGKKETHIKQRNGKIISSLHLANISGKYLRDINDWEYLCVKCHSSFDRGRDSIKKVFKNYKRTD